MDFEIFLQGIIQRTLAVMSRDGHLGVPSLNRNEVVHDVRWIFSKHTESITNLVIQAGITQLENNVSGLFFRAFTVEDVVLSDLCHVGVLGRPVAHLLTSTHGG